MLSRGWMLAGAAVIGAGLVVAACGSDANDAATSTTGAASSGSAAPSSSAAATGSTDTSQPEGSGDLKIAELAAGLEVLAVGTYQAALDAAGAGSLGEVPPAVAEYVTTSLAQHQQHLDAWNKVITAGGGAAVTEPNATLKPTVDSEFAKVKDVAGAATLALTLEQIASATYLSAQNALVDKDAIQLAGSIQIIDARHASILLYVLGQYPVPDVFATVDQAAAA